jgi:ubiquinone/menaquinone biosynthesis C-methylase UbiE
MTRELGTAQAEYREAVRQEWTAENTTEAWRKWHQKMAVQLQAMSDALLEAAGIQPGQRVLDLASGTGLPALDIARVVGPTGRVTATDLSGAMIEIVRSNASEACITNLDLRVLDAETELPFPDACFNAVTSRPGAMYFIDFPATLREVRRVLKPGARAAFAVWGPPDQGTYVEGVLGPFFRRVTLPDLPPDAPNPFRFAAPGLLSSALRASGFDHLVEQTLVVPAPWPGTPDEYWQQFYEIAVPMRPIFNSLPREEFEKARAEAVGLLAAQYDGWTVNATAATVIASGRR